MNNLPLPAASGGAAVVLLLVLAGRVVADPPQESAPQAVKDAWIDGRLETAYALNSYLRLFDLRAEVDNGNVQLSGIVENEIERDLALEIARATEGVKQVDSRLELNPGSLRTDPVKDPTEQRSFAQWVQDATTTARVRSNLGANGNTRDLAIEVSTHYDVVTLSGRVESRSDMMLVEMIARNTEGISSVKNKLEFNEQT